MTPFGIFLPVLNRLTQRNTVLSSDHQSMETSRIDHDEDRLAELGYKQELRRDWSMLHNFGVSFSIIVSCRISFASGVFTHVRCFVSYHPSSCSVVLHIVLLVLFQPKLGLIVIDFGSSECYAPVSSKLSADPTVRV